MSTPGNPIESVASAALEEAAGAVSQAQHVLASLADGVVLIDDAGRIVLANPACARMLSVELPSTSQQKISGPQGVPTHVSRGFLPLLLFELEWLPGDQVPWTLGIPSVIYLILGILMVTKKSFKRKQLFRNKNFPCKRKKNPSKVPTQCGSMYPI